MPSAPANEPETTSVSEPVIEFEVRHREADLVRTYEEWWRRNHRPAYFLGFNVAVGSFLGMLLIGHAWWPLVVAATASSLYAGYLTHFRDVLLRHVREAAARVGDSPFHYRMDDNTFSEKSPLGAAQLPWTTFTTVVRQKESLLVMRWPKDANQFVVLPLAQISPEIQAAIETRIASSGENLRG
ncbi:MAG: hypothetical protein KA385_10845 [Vicinamibacteria bacterium]|nr:hypothetical protein [Vicinamibacteria bacterium]